MEKDTFLKEIVDNIISEGLYIAIENEANFADVYAGGCSYEDFCKYSKQDIDITMFVDMLINEIEKDDRVLEVAGVSFDDVLDIVFTDKALNNYKESESE